MNNFKIKILSASFAILSSFAFAQSAAGKTTDQKTAPNQTEKATQAEAAKKAAAEERARLPKPYNAKEDAEKKIAELVVKAKTENKNIILQAGGNWCIWCLRFNEFVHNTPELSKIVEENYLYYHLNYSPENKNENVFSKYDNPGAKYGYPVFVVLNSDGQMIHTQDSAVLEEGKGYSVEKVKDFLLKWTHKSL